MDMRIEQQYNPYRIFSRRQWAKLREDTPMTLSEDEISALRSMHTYFQAPKTRPKKKKIPALVSRNLDAVSP